MQVIEAIRKRPMSLSTKTMLVLIISAALMIVIVHAVSQIVTVRSFEVLERDQVAADLQRMRAILEERVESLDMKMNDWSNWDDTYKYIVDHNEEYVKANLDPSALGYLNINFMAFIDRSGQIVKMIVVDRETSEEIPIPPGLNELILGSPLGHLDSVESSISGIVSYDNNAIMVCSKPILDSIGEGPVQGTLVFGRFLDQSFIENLAQSAGMHLDLVVVNHGIMPQSEIIPSSISKEDPTAIKIVDDELVEGYALFSDPYGEPAILLSALIPRDIYIQGKATVNSFTIWALTLILVATGIAMLMLELLVIRRLAKLSREVSDLRIKGSKQQVSTSGSDEISDLSRNINQTLESLDGTQKELEAANELLETRVKERTAELRFENEINRSILSTIHSAVILLDQQGLILTANSRFYQVYANGVKEDNIMHLASSQIWEPLQPVLLKVLSANINTSFEFWTGNKANQRLIKADLIPVQEKIMVVLNDITEAHDRQERLYLTDRLSSVGEMAAGVAHELNNPLTSIVSLAELVLEGHPPSDIEEDLQTISSEALRAGGIIKNLLSFARKHTPVKQQVQLNQIIEDVLRLRSYEQTINNITVECHLDPELPEVMADYFQMQQVFLNLVINAEQAMLEAHQKGTLNITSEKVDYVVRFSFKDDGPGIPEENLTRLFDPFFTTKQVGKGTGLGLSICYGIITAHNGKINVKSEVGQGATFTVELPVSSNQDIN